MKKILKIIGVVLILVIVCGFVLGGCFVYNLISRPEFSDEFTLTEDDYQKFERNAKKYEESILEDKNAFTILVNSMNFVESYYFIETQSVIANINYCKDMKDKEAVENYEFAFEMYNDARELYTQTIKKLLLSDSPAAKEMFAEWSDEEKEFYLNSNEKAFEYELENERLLLEYRDLDRETDNWANKVDELYLQIVKNNNAIAKEYEFDNYYEYVSPTQYLRSYTKEDRETFRGFVKEYIIPLSGEVYARLDALVKNADEKTIEEYKALMSDSYKENNDVKRYVSDYIDGFHKKSDDFYENLGDCMNNMLGGELAVFANGENAFEGAFTTYASYFGTPIAFFGKGYQDMLTVVHEAGHFAVFDRLDAVSMPLDFCEVHSQANEWMFIAYLEDVLDPEVYELIKLTRLSRGLDTIILAAAVDECEERIYTYVTESTTKEQLAGMITEELSTYGEDVAEAFSMELYFRYVAPDNPVYYLSYALSEVVALTSFVEAQEDLGAAQRSYLKFVDDSIDPDVIIDGLEEPFDEDTFVDIVNVFSEEGADSGVVYFYNEKFYYPAA